MSNLLHLDGELLQIMEATKVVSSTSSQAVIETSSNTIIITGSEIEVKKLNLEEGEVFIQGKFTSLKFNNMGGKKQPLLKRIFK